jgi:hypothetical protein
MVWDRRRPPNRTKKDSAVMANLIFPIRRHHLAVLEVVITRGKIKMVDGDRNSKPPSSLIEDPKALWHDFNTNTVAGYCRNSNCRHKTFLS